MNRVINVLSFVLAVIYTLIVVALVYDLSLSSFTLKGMPFKFEITLGLAVLVLLLGLVRMRRRWEGMRDLARFSKFTYTTEVSPSSRQSAAIITGIEVLFMLALTFLCSQMLRLEPLYIIPMMAVLAILAIEGIIFLLRTTRGGDAFRIGVGPDVIAYFNREIHLFYYTGLLRVELMRTHINFQYKDDLNLILPVDTIRKEDRAAFRDEIIRILSDKNVYIDDAFRKFE